MDPEDDRQQLEAEVSRRTMELVQTNQELQRQGSVDTALAEISTRFLESAVAETDAMILESIEAVARNLSARTGVVYLADPARKIYRTAFQWSQPRDPGCVNSMRPLEFEQAHHFIQQLLTREGLHLRNAHLLPERAGATPEAIAAPILLQRAHAGFLIFAGGADGRPWEDADVKLVSMTARILSSALDREAMERENKKLQEQLIQSQKMEAVGTLTGGIAHDFNNMLVPIIGYSGLLEQALKDHPKWRAQAEEIHRAAESAATLTRQLLAFSRRQILEKEVCELNEVLEESRNLISRLIGDNFELRLETDGLPLYALVDKGQIHQVLMNLCINARDAMNHGGRITIRIEKLGPDAKELRFVEGGAKGDWTCISVIDSGQGMAEETAARIFEPFFTTKGSRGTGLGLSVVHGIVKQHEGEIQLTSKLAEGTTFRIFLPLQDAKPVTVSAPDNMATLNTSARGERILIVEDEPQVQEFVRRALTSCGYSVEVADDLPDARELLEGARNFKPFNLLFCDCVLPSGNGVDLIVEELSAHPETRAILTTGYTDRESLTAAAEDFDVAFLQKPYALEKLFEVVRRTLDGRLAEAV